jgi:tetratricopeptide (TPR) repeat protein
MERRVINLFLSSTAKDLTGHRIAVHERLTRTKLFNCEWQEDFGAQDADAVEYCQRMAQESDIYVGLIGLRRGWEPDGDPGKRSITEMEHDWARGAGRRRYLWVSPDDFPVPGDLHESDGMFARQLAFRKRIKRERIVSSRGFGTPALLGSEVVEHLLTQVVTTDLLKLVRPEAVASNEERSAPVAAAIARLAADKDVDLLALAKNPAGIGIGELESKLMAREKELEMQAQRTAVLRAEYWRHIGALAFLQDTQKALAAYKKAVELDKTNPDGWRYLGELYYRLGHQNMARDAFRHLQKLAVNSCEPQTQVIANLRVSWLEKLCGNLPEAERLVAEALTIATEAGWLEGMARASRTLGNIALDKDDLVQAEALHLESLKLEEERGNMEGKATQLCNLGAVYLLQENLERAEKMLVKSLKLHSDLSSKEGMASAYVNLGLVYEKRGEIGRAVKMQRKALQFYEELHCKVGMAGVYASLGFLYEAASDLSLAEEMHLKALRLEEQLGRKEGMAISREAIENLRAAKRAQA